MTPNHRDRSMTRFRLSWEEICLRCLKKEITERYSTAVDLAKALRAFCKKQSPKTPYWPTGLPSWVAATGIAAVVVTGILLTYFVFLQLQKQNEALVNSEENPPDSTSMQPLEPEPGRWFPLLARDPKPVMWPESSRYAGWKIDKLARELSLHCNVTGLLELGTIAGDTFEFQLDLYQPSWDGGVGVYFGRTVRQKGDDEYVTLHLFLLQSSSNSVSRENTLSHCLITFKNGNLHSRATPTKFKLDFLNPSEDYPFYISVADGRISQVKWGRKLLNKTDEPLNDQFSKDFQFSGSYGLFIQRASAVVRQAEIFYPPEETDGQPDRQQDQNQVRN